MRAAVRGVIDFRAARPRDIAWWRRTNILIEAMARDDDLRITEALLHRDCAYVANGWLEETSFKDAQDRARQGCLRLIEALKPWTSAETTRAESMDSLTDAWKSAYGDPNDPEVMARIEEGIRRHNEERQLLVRETDEQRVARLLRDQSLAKR